MKTAIILLFVALVAVFSIEAASFTDKEEAEDSFAAFKREGNSSQKVLAQSDEQFQIIIKSLV